MHILIKNDKYLKGDWKSRAKANQKEKIL